MKWEYKVVFVGSEGGDEDEYEKRLHGSVQTLNDLGGKGWELIGFLPHVTAANLTKYHAVFKREKTG